MKKLILPVAIVVVASLQIAASVRCSSPQYLEIGKSGVIDCEFNEDFSTINWFYKLDITDGPPTISYTNERKRGKGYESGEFDIQEDGSLIINNVTVEHETRFTVYWYINDPNDLKRHDVEIKTIIRPIPAQPIIDNCDNSQKLCYIPWREQTPLICRVQQARPAITLNWSTSTQDGDVSLNDKTIYINQTVSWTSTIVTEHPFTHTSHLAVLVCKADDPLKLLEESQTLVLVHNKETDRTQYDVNDVAVKRNGRLIIPCTESDYQLLLWEILPRNGNTTKTLLYDVTSFEGFLHNPHGYGLQSGSLVISDVSTDHEGLYICTYSDGTDEAVNVVNVTVYVTPVPGYPIIEGCTQEQYCVLVVDTNGRLTCTVKGIRPEVKLEWRVFHEESKELLTFHGQQVHTRSNGDSTMDVTLTTEFTAKQTADKRVTLECTVVGRSAKYFDLSSKVELLFSGSVQQRSTESSSISINSDKHSDNIGNIIIIVIVVVVSIVFLIVTLSLYAVYRRRRKPSKPSKLDNNEEDTPMIPNAVTPEMQKFVSQLKFSYENLYSAIKPIPFLQDHCTVHDLFVEGGIEYSLKNKIMKNTWKDLESYRNLFTHSELTGNRWIIEGEPGYGKSTLSLQLAYEWCAKTEGWFMCEVEIFILIRLRQLKGVSSIYEAIKQFILPRNSHFSVDDIGNFIAKSSSVLIILDGYDEYPDSEERSSDIFDIVERKMFPETRVVLTTRSSQLPKQFAAQTNRIRLTGFNSDCQERYLNKLATVNGYKSAKNNIKEWLEENPILKDLCEVPLFFVAYAHLSLESDALKNCTSVTTFFRYMVTCLHSHMRSKFLADNAQNFEINENEHRKLDELCFESLNGHAKNPVIEKKVLVEKLGEDFVGQYLQIGILRGEDDIVMSNHPGVQASDHVKVVSNVRFYHSLFCEWYAAHHMANALVNNDEEILEDVDTARHHYVLRFACGIDPKAARDILEHLKITQEGLEILPLLCIVEQFGNVDYILKNLQEMCSGTIQIRDHDTRLAHRSVIQMVDLAASRKITVSSLVLLESFRLVDDNNNSIILNTEVRLPVLDNVEQLLLEHKTTQFNEDLLDQLFKYACRCTNLKEIRVLHSLLPYIIKTKSVLKELSSKNIEVLWYPADVRYSLQLDSGYWQKSTISLRMTEQEYKKVVTAFENLIE